jgi:hypothetical protein
VKVNAIYFVVGDEGLKMLDAMIIKREIVSSCNIDVKILETFKDGLVLKIENIIDRDSLALITGIVNKHKLKILFDNEVYFISRKNLAPLEPIYLSE